jgi:tetratricopeptide (TPR) repeat protein
VLLVGFYKFAAVDNSKSLPLDITTEDDRIMQGLWYEDSGDLNNSYRVFDSLYKDTRSNAYLLEDIRLSLLTGTRLKESEIKLEKLHKEDQKDTKVLRLLMTLHLVQKDFDKAKVEAEKLILLSKDKLDIGVASDAFIYANEPNRALAILNTLYNEEHDEEIAMRMATILYDMYKESKQAISLLEEHDRMHGGSDELHVKLYDIYVSSNDLEGAYKFALRIYNDTGDWQYLNDIAMKYYEINKCDKAYDIMKIIVEQNGTNDQRLKINLDKINNCLKVKTVKKER